MKLKTLFVLVVVCSMTLQAQTRTNPRRNAVAAVRQPAAVAETRNNSQQLPIRRVILYSNGVAYIERRGVVSGDAEVNLSFKQSQVDDVLKSMLVLDLGAGRIGAVSYNSSAPPAARMAEIPFSVAAESNGASGGIAGVLSQLQGARVLVTSTKGTATGSVLTIEKRDTPADKDRPATQTRFLVIASETGEISSFDLADVRSVKLLDEGTRDDLNEFANASASARRRDAKTITVTSGGAGQREMVVSYIIAAPIWKTTYRVVLDAEGKPFFQGWAIVDNVSDEDWTNVRLSLVSGTPVSFIQPIQQPFYRYRPIVPVPEDLKLEPQIYEPGTEGEGSGMGAASVDPSGSEVQTNISTRQIETVPTGVSFSNLLRLEPSARPAEKSGGFQVDGASGSENSFVIDDAVINGGSVETAATGEEIGDLFEYRIEQPVTVPHNRSALIPIVQTKMDGERISVYNQAVRQNRPLSGLLLKNLTPLTLESGSLTVFDRDAYAGEALMERLKPREERVISFALDLGTLVTTKQEQDREPASLVKAVNGTIQVNYFRSDRRIYSLTNQTERERVVYIEHPVRQGWELTDDTPKPAFTTQRYYRFRVVLKPNEKASIAVGEKQGLLESYALRDLSRENLELFITRRYINDAVRQRLEKLLDLRAGANQINARLEGLDKEVEAITADQARLRENIEALSKTAEAKTLIVRYIAKADEQESRLEAINKERQTLTAERERIERELAAAIRSFEI